MLVLSRYLDQSIYIGDEGSIKVKVLGIHGNQVRLGIEAPKEIEVFGEEVFKKIYSSLKTFTNR